MPRRARSALLLALPLVLALAACSDGVSTLPGSDAGAADREPGVHLDSGVPLDGGSVLDATPVRDAEPTADATPAADAAPATDATPRADASPSTDAAAPLDATVPLDASTAPDAATCAPITAAPDVDPWSVRVGGVPFNRITTRGNTIYLVGPNDYIQLGASLVWGGSVVWFGIAANSGSNVIDANDPGRELQLALYDPTRAHQPCAATASCLSAPASCADSISFLGWDPVQGGDRCGNGAAVLQSGQHGDALRVVVEPLQWNPTWDQPNCNQGCSRVPVAVTYTLDYRFVHPNVVEIATEVTSQEQIDHPSTGQEFPTLYVAHGDNGPDLPDLLDAAGNLIALTTPANDGFFVGNFASSEPWVTWQNSNHDYGVALAMDQGIRDWQGWRGEGGSAPYFHNVRAQIAFGLAHGGVVRGISYLALGSFSTVQALVRDTLHRRPPFGVVDVPAASTTTRYTPGAPVHVAGWVLDTEALANVRVELDGQPWSTVATGAPRPDVCAVYPAYADCPNVGWDGDVPTVGLDACDHLLRVVAEDADGNRTVLGERVLSPR